MDSLIGDSKVYTAIAAAIAARVRNIAQRCSEKLYANEDIPFEDLQIISVVIEEFVDQFHHGKEEQAYFPGTRMD